MKFFKTQNISGVVNPIKTAQKRRSLRSKKEPGQFASLQIAGIYGKRQF